MNLPLSLADFLGDWRLDRRTEDAMAVQVIEGDGVVFVKCAEEFVEQ